MSLYKTKTKDAKMLSGKKYYFCEMLNQKLKGSEEEQKKNELRRRGRIKENLRR